MSARNRSTPPVSISANVCPSSSGAPPLRCAWWYDSARVVLLATCPKSPQNRCALSDFAFRYIRRRRSCRLIGALIISPLPPCAQRNTHRSGSFPPCAFCCTQISGTTTRSAILVPSPPLPTHGYRPGLDGELSSPGTEDFSSCFIPLHTMSPLR